MVLNPYFLNGSTAEQDLLQNLIDEQLKMYGVDVYYMPRKYVSKTTVIKEVIGVTKIFHYDGSNTVTNNMFSVKYQLFLNDIYYWGTTEILTYAMTRTYLEDIEFALTTQKQIRFNQRQDRLYLDIDWSSLEKGDWIVMDCYRLLNPNDYTRVWNDSFLKQYIPALIKRQWGQNLMMLIHWKHMWIIMKDMVVKELFFQNLEFKNKMISL